MTEGGRPEGLRPPVHDVVVVGVVPSHNVTQSSNSKPLEISTGKKVSVALTTRTQRFPAVYVAHMCGFSMSIRKPPRQLMEDHERR
jgi:hypothetical protein